MQAVLWNFTVQAVLWTIILRTWLLSGTVTGRNRAKPHAYKTLLLNRVFKIMHGMVCPLAGAS